MRAPLLAAALLLAVAPLVLASCTDRVGFTIGDDCTYNSECTEPLVCRIGRCRKECIENVDCGVGLECFKDPDYESGGCQLGDENMCNLPSDCPANLVCRFSTCTVECTLDVDCGPDASCVQDACVPTNEPCIYNSDCPDLHVCGSEQLCRVECREDRDCLAPRTCDPATLRCVL